MYDLALAHTEIRQGYGEFLVHNKDGTPPSIESFEQIAPLILAITPWNLSTPRYELLSRAVQVIDKNLRVTFIPRMLYDMVFVLKAIKEDSISGSACFFGSIEAHEKKQFPHLFPNCDWARYQQDLQNWESTRQEKCWHKAAVFFDEGPENPVFFKLAYRLNKAAVKLFRPPHQGFTHLDVWVHTETLLEKFHQLSKEPCALKSGPAYHFKSQEKGGMGIADERMKKIIRKAVKQECRPEAEHEAFFYRGCCDSESEAPIYFDRELKIVDSCSYGSSFFAGALYDLTGCVGFYARNFCDVYLISIPWKELDKSPFQIPRAHALFQLYGTGERFHGRTKFWQGTEGIFTFSDPRVEYKKSIRDTYNSPMNENEFLESYHKWHDKRVYLAQKS